MKSSNRNAFRKCEQGSAIVDFSLVAAAIVLMMLALFYIGGRISLQRSANDAALQAARILATDGGPAALSRAHQAARAQLPSCDCTLDVSTRAQQSGARVEVHLTGSVPVLGPAGVGIEAVAHALVETE